MSNSAEEMSFWDHLEELRWTIIRSVIALFVFAIIGFAFMPRIFDNYVLAPCNGDFFLYKYLCKLSSLTTLLPDFCDPTFHVSIQNLKLASQFFTHMSMSFWLALICTFPYLIWEIWKFISPALYDNEKRNVRWVFLFGTIMFFVGCAVGYSLVFPMTLRFLYSYELSVNIVNQLSLESYIDNFLILIFAMGIVFELPLVSWLLSQIGILTRSFFKKYRRHAICLLLFAAAVITPTSDPFTLMAVFIPIYFLWELSAFLVKPDKIDKDDQLAPAS